MPAASPTLRLLSWNLGRVHLGGRVNRWLGLDSRASDRSLGHVARVILRADAEVVAVQELSSEAQLERLRALLGRDWQAAAPARPDCDRRVGLLARRGLAPEFFPVASATGRTAQAATLRIGRERRFAVASLHLDAFDDAARARQAQELLSFAAASGEAAPVLAGDFNFDLTHPAAHRPRDRSTWRALAAA
ncbi:MAG: hypothetical protein EXR72_25740, partial [Myxococcales bacterium]|nr:hypothetical protein [Myxococcales bacterium]